MSIDPLNLGSAPDDGNGQDLRSGGQVINDNFAELDTRTAAAQAAADAAERTLVAGENILIDRTDPDHPVISASSDGAGTVQTVAGVTPDGGGDIPTAGLSSALGLDNKVDKVAGKGLSSSDFTAAEKTKLAGVATDATKNAADAALRDRATHTGTQLAATISDLAAAVRDTVLAGLSVAAGGAIAAADTILAALGKLQNQITARAMKGANGDITSLSGLTTPLSVPQGGTGSTTGVPNMVGATASTAGVKGLVPAPVAGDQVKFFAGDGTFKAVTAAWGSIVGTLAAQADLQAALDLKLNSSLVDFAIVYPNSGTSAAPANALTNSRYTNPNPFPGFEVICIGEVRVAGVWGVTGWAFNAGLGYGLLSSFSNGLIVTQTGSGAVCGSAGSASGHSFGTIGADQSSLPVRVRVYKLRGATA